MSDDRSLTTTPTGGKQTMAYNAQVTAQSK